MYYPLPQERLAISVDPDSAYIRILFQSLWRADFFSDEIGAWKLPGTVGFVVHVCMSELAVHHTFCVCGT